MTRQDILNSIRSAGIVGMGGAGFPTHIKLSAEENSIKKIIINACECEPGIYADYTLMLRHPEQILLGINNILQLFPHAEAVVVTEDDKEDAAKLLEKHISENQKYYSKITTKILKTRYPQGAEKLLVHKITGKKLRYGQLPKEVGCLVCNIATVYAIYEALHKNKPLTERFVTITGNVLSEPITMKVKIGTKVSDLLKRVELKRSIRGSDPNKVVNKIIFGGPMMGYAVASLDARITKTVSGVILINNYYVDEASKSNESNMASNKEDNKEGNKESPCIRCGKCADICPLKLVPCKIAEYARSYDIKSFVQAGGKICMECGSCSYICPAHRQLTQSIKAGKFLIKSQTGGGS